MTAISPSQFIATTEFHQRQLNALLIQYVDLPEAPGILACMLHLQRSIDKARELIEKKEENKKDDAN